MNNTENLNIPNVAFPTEAPLTYHQEINEKIAQRESELATYFDKDAYSKLDQESKTTVLKLWLDQFVKSEWKKYSGVEVENSKFVLAIPISNEQDSVISTLMSLLIDIFPDQVDCKILLLVNNTQDLSEWYISEFLNTLGVVQTNLSDGSISLKKGNQEFILRTMKTPGKSHALNYANEFAIKNNYPVCIAMDADSFFGADSLARLYGRCYRDFVEDGSAVVNSGAYQVNMKNSPFKKFLFPLVNIPQSHISGCGFGWNPQFVNEIGGIPNNQIEDYSLSKIIEMEGKSFNILNEVRVYTYFANDPLRWINIQRRYMRGLLQFLKEYQEKYKNSNQNLKESIEVDFKFLQDSDVLLNECIGLLRTKSFKLLIPKLLLIAKKLIFLMTKYEMKVSSFDSSWN